MKPHYRLKTNRAVYLKIRGRWHRVGTLSCGCYYWTEEYWDKHEANFKQQHRP